MVKHKFILGVLSKLAFFIETLASLFLTFLRSVILSLCKEVVVGV